MRLSSVIVRLSSAYHTSVDRYRASVERYHASVERYHASVERYHASVERYHASVECLSCVCLSNANMPLSDDIMRPSRYHVSVTRRASVERLICVCRALSRVSSVEHCHVCVVERYHASVKSY